MPPAGPIYASTLHRRDRRWSRRSAFRARAVIWSGTATAVAAGLLARLT